MSFIACCSPADTLALEQSKWNELRQTSSLENQQLCKAKKSKEKLSWRQSAPYCRKKHRQMMMIELRGEIPAISAAFCGNSVYIDFDITPRLRACVPVGPNNWKRVIWLHSHFFFFSLKTWFIVSRCSHLFWRRSISPSPSSRAPPHQKFPFPSENGNFTIFAAYQSNSRGGEMEMWK